MARIVPTEMLSIFAQFIVILLAGKLLILNK